METKKYMFHRYYHPRTKNKIINILKKNDESNDESLKIWSNDELLMFFKRVQKKLEEEKKEMLKRIDLHCGDGWTEKKIDKCKLFYFCFIFTILYFFI
jgi:replicative superfamily II helicase